MDEPVVTWTDIDGVTVVHAEHDGPLVANLVFRVGKADEYLHANGVTHMIEHLALEPMGRAPHYQNGSVGTSLTSFQTSGEPGQVAEFLSTVCGTLTDVPVDRLEEVRRVLEVESQERGVGLTGRLYLERYGAGGPGLWGMDEYAIRSAGRDAVRAWARHVFVTGNAILIMSGPPPAGLRLPLLEGGRLPTPPLSVVLPQRPAYVSMGPAAVASVAALPRTHATTLCVDILRERLVTRLRHDLAVAYSPDVAYEPYDGDTAHVLTHAALHPDHLESGSVAMAEVVRALADSGPSEAELDRSKKERLRALDSVDAAAWAFSEGMRWLMSATHRTPAEERAELEHVTIDDVRRVAGLLRDDIVYAVPHGVALPGVAPTPLSSVEPALALDSSGPVVVDPEGARLYTSADGLERIYPDGRRRTVRYATCRATLAWSTGARVLVAPDGSALEVHPAEWSGGRDLVKRIDRATAGVIVPMPDESSPQPAFLPVQRPTVSWRGQLAWASVPTFIALVSFIVAFTGPTVSEGAPAFVAIGLVMGLLGAWVAIGALRARRRVREELEGS